LICFEHCTNIQTTRYQVKAKDLRKLDDSSPIFQDVIRYYSLEHTELTGNRYEIRER
jgi:hypothetical protein